MEAGAVQCSVTCCHAVRQAEYQRSCRVSGKRANDPMIFPIILVARIIGSTRQVHAPSVTLTAVSAPGALPVVSSIACFRDHPHQCVCVCACLSADDYNRVVLDMLPAEPDPVDEAESDYINASYVDVSGGGGSRWCCQPPAG